MSHTHISALTLMVFGAASAYCQITLNPVPERAVGTPALTVTSFAPNLVEGREFFAPEAVVLDNSASPPILYVSDYVNNRVLAWRNATGFTSGQKADLAIGQPDLLTTFPEGPGATSPALPQTGVTRPSGLAVDKNGNLYVADAGNNRVLRYPAPFSQTGQYPIPDLFIGQGTISGHNANYPNGRVSPQGIFLSSGNSASVASLAFDSSGNLWLTDPGNARVLRFKASDLAGSGGGLAADLQLGQLDLNSAQPALSSADPASYLRLNQFIGLSTLAFDPNGNLFVGDLNRVLVFPGPNFSSGMSASTHMLGVFPAGYPFPPGATATQALLDQTAVYSPAAIFFLSGSGSGVGVVDQAYSRIAIFDTFANWPANGPPQAKVILGQSNTCTQSPNQTCKAANNGNPQPSDTVFAAPAGVAYNGTELFLADAGNNRVLDLPQQGSTFGPATRVLGQDYYTANAANLIEGREFSFQGTIGNSVFSDAAMVVDNSSGTPHLYVSDTYNNRVLGFKDLRKFQNGARNQADIVLGQADFTSNLANFPSGDPNKPTKTSLFRPAGLLVDSQGNLYVADSFNGRVLRFQAPFSYTGPAPEPADLVLGQQNFTSTITDPTAATMAVPYGLAFTPACNILTLPCPAPNGLVVSDQFDNRVLYIPTTNGTFVAGNDNGKAATIVFGQTSFNLKAAGSSLTSMNSPHHVSSDTNGYIYVADSGNNRVLIFSDPHALGTPTSGARAAAAITGLSGPEGVFASAVTGEIWVANTGAGTLLRYANYQSVLLGLGSINSIAEVSGNFGYHPLAIIQDQYGDLFVADDAHRVALYFPGLNAQNGASFLSIATRPLAPGAIGTIRPCDNCAGTQFVAPGTAFSGVYPVPTTLADIQVLVDGVAAPLYYVSGNQINFIVPNNARTSGFADVQVVQASTGQILGASQIPMYSVAPGAFECSISVDGKAHYACAVNQDGTVNDATHPALRGQFVTLYMTGQGNIPGGPPDGVPTTQPINAQYPVTVLLNGFDVNSPTYGESSDQHILYSGIDQFPGMWQINVKIPTTVVTTAGVWFAVIANGVANWDAGSGFRTYIYVK
jgi:uncharacterized protein (TIGR03437 family)